MLVVKDRKEVDPASPIEVTGLIVTSFQWPSIQIRLPVFVYMIWPLPVPYNIIS